MFSPWYFLFFFIIGSTDETMENITFVTTNSTSSLPSLILTDLSISENSTLPSASTISEEKGSMASLVDQINAYRYTRILARIRNCESNMKFNDICETYSLANETNFPIRQLNIDFLNFEDLSDRLLGGKFNQLNLIANESLANFSQDDIRFTMFIIQNHGRSFCLLEQCRSRLTLFVESCPILSNTNISQPTLKLFPMLCNLYNEQLSANATECMEEIVYFLHLFYVFWPQFQKCYVDISAGFNGCTTECQTFDHILTKLEQKCDDNPSFLLQMSALSWYPSIHLNEICYEKSFPIRRKFLHTMQKFFVSKNDWLQFYEKPIYRILLLIFALIVVISFTSCFYLKSRTKKRRLDHDYEYRRLHNSSIELGTHSEIPNSVATELLNDESDSNLSEYQRLLFINS